MGVRLGWDRIREILLTLGPLALVVLVVLVAFWFASRFVTPAPPKSITIAAASKGSPYYEAAERYRAFLAESGVELKILETKGSFENLEMIKAPGSTVDAAFVQGGLSNNNDAPDLRSVGRVLLEPVWIFYRGDGKLERLNALVGKRVLIGPAGSGTAALAARLLAANGVTAETATLINMDLPDYVDALDQGRADAGFLVLAPEARTIKRLFERPTLHLMDVTQAEAYVQRFPYLQEVELKAGVVDFAKDLPAANTRILATTAALVVRETLHPALASLLTQAAIAVHGAPRLNPKGEASIFHRAGAFPSADDQEFPLSSDAARVYKSGSPFLQRYLPFWLATLADRLFVMLLPVLGILLPAIRFAPALYAWRIRRRLLHHYWDLMVVEADKNAPTDAAEIDAKLLEIDRIDRAVNQMAIPLAFANQLYDLRGHIDVVRARLVAQRAQAESTEHPKACTNRL